MNKNAIKTEYHVFKKRQRKQQILKDTPSFAITQGELLREKPLRAKAIGCFLYLTGARVGEMVKVKKKDLSFEKLLVETRKGPRQKVAFVVTLRTEKNKRQKLRLVANLKKRNFWCIEPILKYAEQFTDEEMLFPYSTRHIRRINWKWYNFNPHHWRHIRNTHIIGKFGWSVEKRMKYFGWGDPRSAQTYDHTSWKEAVG